MDFVGDRFEEHDEFEDNVCEWLRGHGWGVPPSWTYHNCWPRPMSRAIAARSDPTSRSIRGQADRVAYLADGNKSVRFECKTVGTRHRNLAVELWPLVEHIYRARMGCSCLYAVRHLRDGREYGFLVGRRLLECVENVFVPASWSDQETADLIRWTSPALKRSPIREPIRYVRKPDPRGSGSPYVLIVETEIFRDWRAEFECFRVHAKRLFDATNSHDKTGILDV